MKSIPQISALLGCAVLVSGCADFIEGTSLLPPGPEPVRAINEDLGLDAEHLSQLEAGIYIDPDGCHIWMIDDGLEGYWSRRRDPVSGLPVCTPMAPANSIIGASAYNSDRVPRIRN